MTLRNLLYQSPICYHQMTPKCTPCVIYGYPFLLSHPRCLQVIRGFFYFKDVKKRRRISEFSVKGLIHMESHLKTFYLRLEFMIARFPFEIRSFMSYFESVRHHYIFTCNFFYRLHYDSSNPHSQYHCP